MRSIGLLDAVMQKQSINFVDKAVLYLFKFCPSSTKHIWVGLSPLGELIILWVLEEGLGGIVLGLP